MLQGIMIDKDNQPQWQVYREFLLGRLLRQIYIRCIW